MGKKKLRELLEELRGELEDADSVEPETRNLLKGLMDDIHGVLERRQTGSSEEKEDDEEESLTDRLSQTLAEFESQHPRVAFALERLMKSLADIGI